MSKINNHEKLLNNYYFCQQGCHPAIKDKASDELAALAIIAGVITLVEVIFHFYISIKLNNIKSFPTITVVFNPNWPIIINELLFPIAYRYCRLIVDSL